MSLYVDLDNKVISSLLASAKSDIDTAILILKNSEIDQLSINSLCSFSFAIEKLVRLGLYIRFPILLEKSISAEKLIECHSVPPNIYNSKYILGLHDKAVSASEAWERLCRYHPQLNDLTGAVSEVVKFINLHVHNFCMHPSHLTLKTVQQDVFAVIEGLCKHVLSHFDQTKFPSNLKDLCSDFEELSEVRMELNRFNLKTEFEKQQRTNLLTISAEGYNGFKDFLQEKAIQEAELYVDINCPVCDSERGHLGFTVEGEHAFDSEGDQMLWSEPTHYWANFTHFLCENCGTYTDSKRVLEDLGYDVSALKPEIAIVWEINDAVIDAHVCFRDKKGYSDASDVTWES